MRLARDTKKALALMLSAALVVIGASVPAPGASAATKKVTVKLNKKKATVTVGGKVTLKVTKKNARKVKVTWKSSKKAVAAVTKKGVVTGKKTGKATISAKVTYQTKGSKKTFRKTFKCVVTVNAKKIPDASQVPDVEETQTPGVTGTQTPGTSETASPNVSGTPEPAVSETASPDVSETSAPVIHDNTEEDIQKLNDGKAVIMRYPDTGEVSFINGAYTDYKVTNADEAWDSLMAVETLLNLQDVELSSCIREEVNDNGDTYYTFQQGQGIAMVQDAFIKVGVDRDGNTICLSSSVNPEITHVETSWEEIEDSYDEAQAYAEQTFGEEGYSLIHIDPEDSLELNDDGLVWGFYFQKTEETASEGADSPELENPFEETRFLKVYVSVATGTFASSTQVSSIDADSPETNNDVYFKVGTEEMEFTDRLGKKVKLPVAHDKEKGYYFIDTDRKIICADTYDTFFRFEDEDDLEDSGNFVVPYYFEDPKGVSDIFVSVFENMRIIYDFYEAEGITSIDGRGMPLVLGLGFDPDQDGVEEDNACYAGNIYGFGCFYFSNLPVSVPLDTAAHEFSHGVRSCYNSAGAYMNDTGAIEESYADILGNLIEMQLDSEADWRIGERSADGDDSILRDMADPHAYAQPEYIGDVYYVMNSIYEFFDMDDNGGVHTNSSVLGHVSYLMSEVGIDHADNFEIWKDTVYIITPKSRFREVAEIVKFSLERQGLEKEKYETFLEKVEETFDMANLNGDTTSWDSYEKKPEGAAEVEVTATNMPEGYRWAVAVFDDEDKRINVTCSADGVAKTYIFFPQENAWIGISMVDEEGQVIALYVYNGPITEEGVSVSFDFDELLAEQNADAEQPPADAA